jgi:hypothetical protein
MSITLRHRLRAGTTLVELLVALGIGTAIVAVLVLAYTAVTQSASRHLGRDRQRELAQVTIRELREDVQQLFSPVDDTACAIELENSATSLVRFAFCRWELSAGKEPLMTNRIERVVFFYDTQTGGTRLVRTRQGLIGPADGAPVVTNTLGATWPRLLVHLHDGTSWQANWSGNAGALPGTPPPRPRAARIQLLGDGDWIAHESVVVIPSGLVVTSSIARASISPRK